MWFLHLRRYGRRSHEEYTTLCVPQNEPNPLLNISLAEGELGCQREDHKIVLALSRHADDAGTEFGVQGVQLNGAV